MGSKTGARNWLDEVPRIPLLAGIAATMILPVIVLRAAEGFEWIPHDMVFLAGLMTGIVIAYEVALRVPSRLAYGAGAGLALFTGCLQIWINLAVGIIGSEDNPANLIYAAVIAVAVIGVLVAGFRAKGLATAMTATAVAQAATFIIALVAQFGFTGPITIFFTSLWLISAGLFARSASASGS